MYIYIYTFHVPPTCSLVFSVAVSVVLYSIPRFIFWIQRENAERVQTSGVAADQLQTLEDEEFFVGVKFYQNTRDTG